MRLADNVVLMCTESGQNPSIGAVVELLETLKRVTGVTLQTASSCEVSNNAKDLGAYMQSFISQNFIVKNV